ncbi:O-antigen ligase family protein [Parageobacillus toebii]|uniref:O-antigen ligase family protein n=1 Tax=Parageobacillus toebii TaxID=153151 RepID=UPI0035C70410
MSSEFEENNKNVKIFQRILLLSLFWPLLIGILQLINQMTRNFQFVNNVTGLFTENVYEGRIQLLSGEPSWAMLHILTIGFILIRLYVLKRSKVVLLTIFIMGLLYIFSFSLYGYLVLLISIFLFFVIGRKINLKVILVASFLLITIAVLLPSIINIFGLDNYSVNRFDKFSDLASFKEIVYVDGSFFVRIVFPIIGFLEFLSNPIFGLGGGLSYLEFSKFLLLYFPDGVHFPEVYYNLYIDKTIFTPRNLFSKVLAEEGLIGGTLFIGFLYMVYKESKQSKLALFAFVLSLSIFMNFDSYATINVWMLLGLIRGGFFNEIGEKNNDGKYNVSLSNR